MSTSLKVVSIAAVRWASTRLRAIVSRRLDIRTRSSVRLPGATTGAPRGRWPWRGGRSLGGGWRRRGLAGGRLDIAAHHAPGVAAALHLAHVDLCTSAALRAAGVLRGAVAGALRARPPRRAWWPRAGQGRPRRSRGPRAPRVAGPALDRRRADRRPSRPRLPGAGSSRARRPDPRSPRGRSSRSRARRAGSPTATASPSFLSQRATRASTTDSPSWGTTTCAGHVCSLCLCLGPRARGARRGSGGGIRLGHQHPLVDHVPRERPLGRARAARATDVAHGQAAVEQFLEARRGRSPTRPCSAALPAATRCPRRSDSRR